MDHCLSFCPFSFGNCIVFPYSIYDYLLFFGILKHFVDSGFGIDPWAHILTATIKIEYHHGECCLTTEYDMLIFIRCCKCCIRPRQDRQSRIICQTWMMMQQCITPNQRFKIKVMTWQWPLHRHSIYFLSTSN